MLTPSPQYLIKRRQTYYRRRLLPLVPRPLFDRSLTKSSVSSRQTRTTGSMSNVAGKPSDNFGCLCCGWCDVKKPTLTGCHICTIPKDRLARVLASFMKHKDLGLGETFVGIG
jgi:hypothetical protein